MARPGGRKAQLATAIDSLGLGARGLKGTWRGVVTLSYHRLIPNSNGSPPEAGEYVENLERQLQLLRDHCDVVTTDQLDERSVRQRGRRVALTVDDCYRDSYEVAFPLLRQTGIGATFFVVSGILDGEVTPWWDEIVWMATSSKRDWLEASEWWRARLSLHSDHLQDTLIQLVRLYWELPPTRGADVIAHLADATGSGRRPVELTTRDFITWDMAREMAAGGMGFGGHTETHPVLATLPQADQQREIERGLDRIGSELGVRPSTLAYPVGRHGMFDDSTKAAAAAAGVRLAFSNYGGYSRPSNWDPLEIRRVGVSPATPEPEFRWTVCAPALFARESRRGPGQPGASD